MVKEIYTSTLPKVFNILYLVFIPVLLLFSSIFYLKGSYTGSVIFFAVTIVFAISSTYKKSIYFDDLLNSVSIDKKYLGTTVTSSKVQIIPQSELKLFTEKHKGTNSMGYTEHSHFLTLAITGKTQKEPLGEIVLCSALHDSEKKVFLERVKNISEIIDVQIVES